MFVIEAAIFKAADKMGINAQDIQQINLLKSNDVFHYGQTADYCKAEECWNALQKRFDFQQITRDLEKFNSENKFYKKGIAFMPVCFGISFTNSFLNQASALVHIYTDGSIGISTAAVEMGQGVNEKLRIIASRIFSIGLENIKIETTNTTRIANTSATAASSASDLNGNALITACNSILGRLNKTAADYLGVADPHDILFKNGLIYYKNKKTDLTWTKLIGIAYRSRVNLSSHAYYATPDLHFDNKKATGKPFAYHVYGSAAIISKLDCLRGIFEIESVKVVHDIGKSLNELVDKGQAEGAITQGIGWLTLEEIAYSDTGQLLSNSLSTYKVPDIFHTAAEIDVHFLENSENPIGPFNSKAIGEPPFMYGIGAYFATLNAMKAFKPQLDLKIDAPLTNEKVLMALYSKIKEEIPG